MLLLDEPLGALDLKLRENMQEELKSLQKSLGITFVFVTHDQGEALSMADRIAVFNDGKIMQVGTPEEIYQRPKTRFVADFVGSSNVLPPDFVAALCRPEALGEPAARSRSASSREATGDGVAARSSPAPISAPRRGWPRCRGPAHQRHRAGRRRLAGRRRSRLLTFNRDICI